MFSSMGTGLSKHLSPARCLLEASNAEAQQKAHQPISVLLLDSAFSCRETPHSKHFMHVLRDAFARLPGSASGEPPADAQ